MNTTESHVRSRVQMLEVSSDQDGQRIDNYLMRILKGAPKSLIYRIIRKGEVRVNKGRIKTNYRLRQGDKVRVPPVRLESATARRTLPETLTDLIRNSVLFENDDCLVINKPSGLAVHGGSGIKFGLLDVVHSIRPEQKYLELVHRLDRETSGCILLAKNRKTLIFLHEQLKQGVVTKKYLTGLAGNWKGGKKTVTAPLRKNVMQGGERIVEVDPQGKSAVSHFSLIQQYRDLSLMEVELETGRTHQIRVHACHAGHPVAGDKKYGDKSYNSWIRGYGLKRLFLHAHLLEFRLPGMSDSIQVSSPLSPELQEVLNRLE